MALEVGSRLGHYDVTALIGEGGMGQVPRVVDSQSIATPRPGHRPDSADTERGNGTQQIPCE